MARMARQSNAEREFRELVQLWLVRLQLGIGDMFKLRDITTREDAQASDLALMEMAIAGFLVRWEPAEAKVRTDSIFDEIVKAHSNRNHWRSRERNEMGHIYEVVDAERRRVRRR